jgi:hypothetical protein
MSTNSIQKAYLAFQTDALKDEVRDLLISNTIKILGIKDPNANTPWKMNLFRIEEFEKYSTPHEAYEKLKFLNGGEQFKQIDLPFISTPKILFSHIEAQTILGRDKNLEEVVKRAKEESLNYIIKGVYNGKMESCAYNGSIEVLTKLTKLAIELSQTYIAEDSRDFGNQLIGYTENSLEQKFILKKIDYNNSFNLKKI